MGGEGVGAVMPCSSFSRRGEEVGRMSDVVEGDSFYDDDARKNVTFVRMRERERGERGERRDR